MLVIRVPVGESIQIGDAEVIIAESNESSCKVCVDAPREIRVSRNFPNASGEMKEKRSG